MVERTPTAGGAVATWVVYRVILRSTTAGTSSFTDNLSKLAQCISGT